MKKLFNEFVTNLCNEEIVKDESYNDLVDKSINAYNQIKNCLGENASILSDLEEINSQINSIIESTIIEIMTAILTANGCIKC